MDYLFAPLALGLLLEAKACSVVAARLTRLIRASIAPMDFTCATCVRLPSPVGLDDIRGTFVRFALSLIAAFRVNTESLCR